MNKAVEVASTRAVDALQARLTDYACGLRYEDLQPEAIHAAKVRVIDTLGALLGGFFGEPCRIARNMAAQLPMPTGATVIGTRMKTAPDVAAFANAATARYVEMNDVYHWPGSAGGHPSDVLTPVLAAAEHAGASGRDLLTGIVLAYEVYLRLSDAVHLPGFDCANFCCIGSAIGAGKVLGLTREQMHHCISMAAVPNNALNQGRTGHLSMWKAVAAGQAGRAGVYAALLAREGMQGPHLPFEGKNGWFNYISRKPFTLDTLGGGATAFRILDTLIKPRSSCATTISSIIAAEKAAAALKDVEAVSKVTVEVYERAKIGMGTGEHHWNPDARETADHSIPYVVAASLIDRRLTPASFNDARLWDPRLRRLLPKIEVVSNPEFTAAYERVPVEHHTRVTVVTAGGERLVGESGGEKGDLSQPKTDAQIEEKFRGLTQDLLGAGRVSAFLEQAWTLDATAGVGSLVGGLVIA